VLGSRRQVRWRSEEQDGASLMRNHPAKATFRSDGTLSPLGSGETSPHGWGWPTPLSRASPRLRRG